MVTLGSFPRSTPKTSRQTLDGAIKHLYTATVSLMAYLAGIDHRPPRFMAWSFPARLWPDRMYGRPLSTPTTTRCSSTRFRCSSSGCRVRAPSSRGSSRRDLFLNVLIKSTVARRNHEANERCPWRDVLFFDFQHPCRHAAASGECLSCTDTSLAA